MTALVLAPTTDTLQGWLVIACLAFAAVCLGSAALAAADAVMGRIRAGRAFDLELAQLRVAGPLLPCQVVEVDGIPITIQTDRPLDAADHAVLRELVTVARRRAALDEAVAERRAAEVDS